MVVGRTPLTEELYGDCIIDEYEKHYAVNIRNRFKSTATHIVVTNYGHHKGEHDVPYAEYEYNRAEIGQLVLFETNQPYGKNR